jgi:hypothetical protein
MWSSRHRHCFRRCLDGQAAVAAALALALAGAGAATDEDAARGRRLFSGEAAVPARIAGQDVALPAQASRCVNCHVAGTAPPASAAATAAGPALNAQSLARPQRRRGGPPSRYDASSLCTLLRSGVDPAYVIIQRTMPRYEITDADCRALWAHLAR